MCYYLILVCIFIQIPVVTEALYAAFLLLQIVHEYPQSSNEVGFTNFWNLVLNSDKALFINEKMLFQFNDEGR